MVLLNAAACAVPAIASRIHGSTDALVDGVTGLLHEAGDHMALMAHLVRLANDVDLRRQLGDTARARVVELFSEAVVSRELATLYENLLERSDPPRRVEPNAAAHKTSSTSDTPSP
jgi:glycosyltransferase involved in cell wall biosynthesis